MSRVDICGVRVDSLTAEAVVARIATAVAERAGLAVFSANVDMIVRAARSPAFAADLAAADLLLADGMPLLWMARGLGSPLPERVAGVDLTQRLARVAAERSWPVFFLGSAPGVAERAAAQLIRESPALKVAGTLSPPMGFEGNAAERERVVAAVEAAKPDLVLVGLGAPKQERWILEERKRLHAGALLGVGGTFDILAGDRRRAPRALQRAGLEWAYRWAQDPVRLGRRYFIDDAAIAPLYARALWRRWGPARASVTGR
jgi:N-acetylglucosaminyldiphosphoundecaprenol N-acetyl-beta-D-mannosaminyltransferase